MRIQRRCQTCTTTTEPVYLVSLASSGWRDSAGVVWFHRWECARDAVQLMVADPGAGLQRCQWAGGCVSLATARVRTRAYGPAWWCDAHTIMAERFGCQSSRGIVA